MLALAWQRLSRRAGQRPRAGARQLFGVLAPLSVRALRRAAGRARAARAVAFRSDTCCMSHAMDQQPTNRRHRAHRGAEAPPARALDRDRARARRAGRAVLRPDHRQGAGVLIRPCEADDDRDRARPATLRRRDAIVAVVLRSVFVAVMVGAAYAAVPLYNWFCRATGFGGTTQVATAAPARRDRPQDDGALRRQRRPRAAVAASSPSRRDRGQDRRGRRPSISRSPTQSARAITGQAAFNVTPISAGAYFNKIKCFCFTEQTLKAGREARNAGGVLRRSGDGQGPDWTTSTPSRCPIRSIRVREPARSRLPRPDGSERSRRAEIDRRHASSATERRRRRWPTRTPSRPRLPPGRSEPVAGRRLDLGLRAGGRRRSLDASHVLRPRRSCSAPACIGVLYTMFALVARRHQAKPSTRAITPAWCRSRTATA